MFGKGKVSAVAIIQKHDLKLDVFGDPRVDFADVFKAGLEFVCLLNREQNVVTSMNQHELRHKIFSSKKNTPRIKSLHPTDPTFAEHIKHVHLQTMKWKASDLLAEPDVDITTFGWRIDHGVPHPCA